MPHSNDDYDYDFYDQLEDAALARLRNIDAMSEEDTDDEDDDRIPESPHLI